jgi:nitroimidazol reductase NimA-like FMN-containing flavoprotein (pyridoxamine 5'-phosphate oxidase superfamily)
MTAPHTGDATGPRLCCDDVWHALDRASFAVLSHVNAAGEPRSSGIVYAVEQRRLYVAVAPNSWKARSIADGGTVSVTVPVRRGGLLSLLFPIPRQR